LLEIDVVRVSPHLGQYRTAHQARTSPRKGVLMVEIHLEESDRLDWALKAFKRKIAKAGILKDLRKKRYYVKPSEARQLKAAAARRRSRTERSR
jgi:small subunit ribosomal protein S21